MKKEDGYIFFGWWDGIQADLKHEVTDNFEDYKNYKNKLSRKAIYEHIKGLEFGLACTYSVDKNTGKKLEAGIIYDGNFVFPYEFLYFYSHYDIGIPYEYEEYLVKIGVNNG